MNVSAFFRHWIGSSDQTAHELYTRLVAQARHPVFYTAFGVPDTIEGRYDMIVLHAYILFRRLRGSQQEQALAQDVFDFMFKDMDRSLREMGVGDLSVPKRIKKLAQTFYGCAGTYEAAINAADETELAVALARNVLRSPQVNDTAMGLSNYVRAAVDDFAAVAFKSLLAGELPFPDPSTFAAGGTT